MLPTIQQTNVGGFAYDIALKVSLESKLSVNDIDELETQAGCYDFEKITKLLDFYKTKLPISARCFKRMPKKLADQYFKS